MWSVKPKYKELYDLNFAFLNEKIPAEQFDSYVAENYPELEAGAMRIVGDLALGGVPRLVIPINETYFDLVEPRMLGEPGYVENRE